MMQRVKALKHLLLNNDLQLRRHKAQAFTDWKWQIRGDSDRLNRLNLQEDLHQVVAQLNTFRVQLVFSKLKTTVQSKLR